MSQQGWECPKCGTVYAPWVWKCSTCAGLTVTAPTTLIDCDHLWVTDTFGTRCSKCGQIAGTEQVRYSTGTPPIAFPENTCRTGDTEERAEPR